MGIFDTIKAAVKKEVQYYTQYYFGAQNNVQKPQNAPAQKPNDPVPPLNITDTYGPSAASTKNQPLQQKADSAKQNAVIAKKKAIVAQVASDVYFKTRDKIISDLKAQGFSQADIEATIAEEDNKAIFSAAKAKIWLKVAAHQEKKAARLELLIERGKKINIAMAVTGASVETRSEVMDAAVEEGKAIVADMSAEDIPKSTQLLSEFEAILKDMAGGDVTLLAKANSAINAIGVQIAAKMLPPKGATEADYANAQSFVDYLSLLPVRTIKSDLTQIILDKIAKNAEMNRVADKKSYEVALKNNKDIQTQDRMIALNKKLQKAVEKIQQEINLTSAMTQEDVDKAIANIVANINKRIPLI